MSMTPEQVKSATTSELLAVYNKLTGNAVKKFSSRAAGEKQVLAAFKKFEASGTKTTVRGKSGESRGRPATDALVTLTEEKGESKLQAESARTKILEFLRGQPGKKALVSEIATHLKLRGVEGNVRGYLGKLSEKSWITVELVAAA